MNDGQHFKDRVALVTGAGSGIGRAAALAFARKGARVVVSDVSGEEAQRTVRQVEELGGQALAVTADVGVEDDVRRLVAKAVEAFGRLDVAFNNAGIEHDPVPTAELETGLWDRVVATDLRGVFLCLKHEIPAMLQQGGGAIVNTSSGAGVVGVKGLAAYTASKHGVIGLTKAAALDYAAANVRVNAIVPGYIATEMMQRVTGGTPEGEAKVVALEPMGRMGRPEEVAAAAVWLCSDEASFVTGHAMAVDGGFIVP